MGEPGAGQGGTGQVRTGQGGTGQVCTSRFRTVQVRTGQVETSQAGQVSTGQNSQVLLGIRVWPFSVLLVFLIFLRISAIGEMHPHQKKPIVSTIHTAPSNPTVCSQLKDKIIEPTAEIID